MAARICLLFAISVLLAKHSQANDGYGKAPSSSVERGSRDDDPTLQDLMNTVDQQASVIQGLQSQLNAEKNRGDNLQNTVDTLKSGSDDMKAQLASLSHRLETSVKQVGFTARFSHDGGQYVGVSLGDHSTLVFDSAVSNTGAAYDTNTGIFRAPVAGLYSFFLTQMTADDHSYLRLSIVREGYVLDQVYTEGAGQLRNDTHDQGATQVVTHLQAGNRVWVRHESGGSVRGIYFTVFTGYLIHAD